TGSRSTIGVSSGASPWVYLLNQAEMLVTYLRLTAWPAALVSDYGPPRLLATRDVIPQVAPVVALLVFAALAVHRWRYVGALLLLSAVTLAPTTSIIPISSEVGAERRMYVPLAALSVLVVLAARSVIERLGARIGQKRARTLGAIGAAVVIVGL